MSIVPTLQLNDGHHIPQFGLGTWLTPPDAVLPAINAALACGYRAIDTASIYNNEAAIGEALRDSGIPRSQIYLTTKVWNTDQGFDSTLRAFDESLAKLGTDHADLYLVHWPIAMHGKYLDTWKALVRLRAEGRARSIGVSNFQIEHLKRVIGETGVVPAVNQIELHPDFTQDALRAFHARHGILTESWSPLAQGKVLLTSPVVQKVAAKHQRTPAQVILRWHIDLGLVVIPKSITPARIRENFDIWGFKLDSNDLAELATLDADNRIGPDPDKFDMITRG
ncbi:MAG: aldo/keto reductase [Puniceicoccales bacterium]|jgi:2,5-diketo-D-gluconate reductase A|nr:aldo/keto reductase [Puniceicoccales bacterium]